MLQLIRQPQPVQTCFVLCIRYCNFRESVFIAVPDPGGKGNKLLTLYFKIPIFIYNHIYYYY